MACFVIPSITYSLPLSSLLPVSGDGYFFPPTLSISHLRLFYAERRQKDQKREKTLLAEYKLYLSEEKRMLVLFVPKQLIPLCFQDL